MRTVMAFACGIAWSLVPMAPAPVQYNLIAGVAAGLVWLFIDWKARHPPALNARAREAREMARYIESSARDVSSVHDAYTKAILKAPTIPTELRTDCEQR